MEDTFRQLIVLLRDGILDTSVASLATQYAVIVALALVLIYGILRMRKGSVLILSHGRILASTLLASALNLCLFRLFVGFKLYQALPFGAQNDEWWKVALFLLVGWILLTVWRIVLNLVTYPVARDSVKDLISNEAKAFNCNWPLIPRCASFAFLELILTSSYLLTTTP